MRIRKVPPRSGCLAFAGGGSPSAKLSRSRNPNVPAAVAAAPNLSKLRREIGCGVGRDSITESLLRPQLARAGLGLAVLHSAWRFCECRRSQYRTRDERRSYAQLPVAPRRCLTWMSQRASSERSSRAAAGCGGGRPAVSRGSSTGREAYRWRARTVACL